MDLEHLIGSVVRGALTGKKKKHRRASHYLSGGKGSFLNASTLIALAGVAWGVYETATKKNEPVYAGPGPQPAGPPPGSGYTPSPVMSTPPPPLPGIPSPAPAAGLGRPDVPEEVVRIIRLVVSAARADGTLTDQEQAAIVEQARAAGAETIVQRELSSTFTLSSIVAGVAEPRQREELYTLAFAIVRADEQVTGGERIYLAQLAHQLGLDAETAARLEREASARIDTTPE